MLQDQRKLPDQVLPWQNAEIPFLFCDVNGVENRLECGSYINKAEASRIEQLVTRMLQRGISPDRIGIITQYVGQKDYLVCPFILHLLFP